MPSQTPPVHFNIREGDKGHGTVLELYLGMGPGHALVGQDKCVARRLSDVQFI